MLNDPTPNHDLPGADRTAPHWFQNLASTAADWSGSRWVFLSAIAIIVAWAISGVWFHFSDTWQLIINTTSAIVTFLMVFLIQNTQNRDAKAIHLKLDEIIRAIHPAKNEMISVEKLSDEELNRLAAAYAQLREEVQKRKHKNVA
jgi:low affinity Fe/Cu permease